MTCTDCTLRIYYSILGKIPFNLKILIVDIAMKLEQLIEDDVFSPTLIARELRTRKSELAEALGLKAEEFTKEHRIRARKTQSLLRELVEILDRVEKHSCSILVAYAWYRSARLIGFGDTTAEMLVKEGKASHVRAYLDHVENGGYA